MPSSNVDFVINESIAVVTVNRPEARNAFTWDMYLALFDILDAVGADEIVRVLIIRGSDGAFSAGTDISHFKNFVDADSGIVYERRLEQLIDRLERLPVATIAEVDGARRRRRMRDRDGVRPSNLFRPGEVRRTGGAYSRQLSGDRQHGATR
jgi:enoyl-CoA hydratase/carnithine racemase